MEGARWPRRWRGGGRARVLPCVQCLGLCAVFGLCCGAAGVAAAAAAATAAAADCTKGVPGVGVGRL
jgi:hypothetical protein